MRGGQAGGQPLERLADEQDLPDLGQRQDPHQRAATREDRRQPVFLQPLQRLADGRPTDAQKAGQLSFGQRASRRELSGQDLCPDGVVGEVPSQRACTGSILAVYFEHISLSRWGRWDVGGWADAPSQTRAFFQWEAQWKTFKNPRSKQWGRLSGSR